MQNKTIAILAILLGCIMLTGFRVGPPLKVVVKRSDAIVLASVEKVDRIEEGEKETYKDQVTIRILQVLKNKKGVSAFWCGNGTFSS